MIERAARHRLLRLAQGFPVVVLTGPRQSGKTTLARSAFPQHTYVSVEDPDVRERVDKLGFDLASSTPGELAAFLPEQLQAWSKAFADAGMQAE